MWFTLTLFVEIMTELWSPDKLWFGSIVISVCFAMRFCVAVPPFRSSHRRCSVRKGVLTNFAKFTGKHLCQSLFFNKLAAVRPATLLKKRLWHRGFPVNFVKFLRTYFLKEHLRWLLLFVLFISQIRVKFGEKVNSSSTNVPFTDKPGS